MWWVDLILAFGGDTPKAVLVSEVYQMEDKFKGKVLIAGMGSVMGLGAKPRYHALSLGEAFEHDFGLLWEDLLKVLVEVIKKMPPEKRRELKEYLLSYDPENDDLVTDPRLLKTHPPEQWMNMARKRPERKERVTR